MSEVIKQVVDELLTEDYNGWANYETWNVALHIGDNEGLYRAAVAFARRYKKDRNAYKVFINSSGMSTEKTSDGVKWFSNKLDYAALDDMIMELA